MITHSENPVLRTLREYAAAVLAKDIEGFASLYDREAFIFDAWDVWSYIGLDAWQGVTREWFTSLGAERVAVGFEDVRSSVSTTLAYATATVRYSALSPEGQTLRSLQNRMTIVLELKNTEWKIVHQHTSSPSDFQTKSAILNAR